MLHGALRLHGMDYGSLLQRNLRSVLPCLKQVPVRHDTPCRANKHTSPRSAWEAYLLYYPSCDARGHERAAYWAIGQEDAIRVHLQDLAGGVVSGYHGDLAAKRGEPP